MSEWLQVALIAVGSGGIGGLAGTFFGPKVQDSVAQASERRRHRRELISRWRTGIAELSDELSRVPVLERRKLLYGHVWFRELQGYLRTGSMFGPSSGSRYVVVIEGYDDDPFTELTAEVNRLAREWGVD